MTWLPGVEKEERNWVDQWERIKRWRSRLSLAKPLGEPTVSELDEYRDFAHAFFVECYHLRDWLIGAKISCHVVDDFVCGNDSLAACHGLCNGVKHFKLKSVKPGEHYREFVVTRDGIEGGSSTGLSGSMKWKPSGLVPGDYMVDTSRGAFEVQSLADQCVAVWEAFISTREELEGRTADFPE